MSISNLVLDLKKYISYSLTEYLSLGYFHRPAALTSAIFIFIWIVDISGIKMLYFISFHFISFHYLYQNKGDQVMLVNISLE